MKIGEEAKIDGDGEEEKNKATHNDSVECVRSIANGTDKWLMAHGLMAFNDG